MQILKGVFLFSILSLAMGACFDPPEFSNSPKIIDYRIEYFQDYNENDFKYDSLVLYLGFTDGDGDIGLPGSADGLDFPYNKVYLFQGEGNTADTFRIPPLIARYTDNSPVDCLPPFLIPDPTKGKFITSRIRDEEPGYSTLPSSLSFPEKCYYYYDKEAYLVEGEYRNLFDSESIVDSIAPGEAISVLEVPGTGISYDCSQELPGSSGKLYLVYDNFFVIQNPNYYNIEIDFLIKNNGGTFDEFDWVSEFPPYCGISYDSRLPVLSGSSSPLEGTIRYTMSGVGFNSFLQLFSIKTLKLRITIKDRALNKSNVLETEEFTISSKKVN